MVGGGGGGGGFNLERKTVTACKGKGGSGGQLIDSQTAVSVSVTHAVPLRTRYAFQ